MFGSFEGKGKEMLVRGSEGNGEKGERREIIPLIWKLKNQQRMR
jgi:hypothetical protein